MIVFPHARDAMAFAVDVQKVVLPHPWPDRAPLRIRIGMHTGTPALVHGQYVGLDVHRAARISSAGHGGTGPPFPAPSVPLLPRKRTSFIGREREIDEVKRAVASSTLITIVGAGGAGKTRLALQVAADMLARCLHGARLVGL